MPEYRRPALVNADCGECSDYLLGVFGPGHSIRQVLGDALYITINQTATALDAALVGYVPVAQIGKYKPTTPLDKLVAQLGPTGVVPSNMAAPGPQGIQGLPGTPGTNGVQGIQGIQGVKGDTGTTGTAGTNGTNWAPIHTVLANDTLALALATNTSVRLTVTAARTLTTTVPPAGSTRRVLILTSGSSSFVVTFGSGFKPTATLATGTTTARVFVVSFISDGTNLYEMARTIAMVA